MNTNLKSLKTLNIVIFVMCTLAVVSAVLIQIFYKLNPCAICILARYIILGIGLLNFISIFISKIFFVRILKDFSFLLIAFGMGYSLKHIYIVHQKIDTCSIDKLQILINSSPLANLLPAIFESNGSCLDSNFVFIGIPFTILTFVFYVVLIFLVFFLNKKIKIS